MRALTDHEKRTLRLGMAIIGIYLLLFYGMRGWRALESRRADYQKLVQTAGHLRLELQTYETKALTIEKLKNTFQIEPKKLSKPTLVAEASAAIQKAATAGGVQIGPIRESSARANAKELTSMQVEASGPVAAVTSLLHRLETLGYPIVLDSLQITADAQRPGTVKVNLTVVILDYEQWNNPEVSHG